MPLTTRTRPGRSELGRRGEELAARYLTDVGYTVVDRNWRCGRLGEVDIVAVDPEGACVVAVEVKTRRGRSQGGPLEAVTPVKVERLGRLAAAWCRENSPNLPRLRVDVIGIETDGCSPARLTHVLDVTG